MWRVFAMIDKAIRETRITDLHTHLYSAEFGGLLLRGVDDLLTYHYLAAETMRWADIPYEKYFALTKREQADLVWKTLFLSHSPISESCRGVLTTLAKFGLDVSSKDLNEYRAFFDAMPAEEHIERVFELSGVESVVMTNDPFDAGEGAVWEHGAHDARFHAALRLDSLLSWETAWPKLAEWGYDVDDSVTAKSIEEVKRFIADWIDRMGALYMAASLPPDFTLPEDSTRGRLIEECVIPVACERGIPLAVMLGVKRLVNPALGMLGDSLGRSSIETVEYMCAKYPDARFMVTMLSRENQHELCVTARKFRNLMVFGCWWFLNNPSLIEEITRMRFELLGESFIPQHSDARVLDQLIYKWSHSKEIIGRVLAEKYEDIRLSGWPVNEADVKRDVESLLSGNFWRFVKGEDVSAVSR